jgi:ATP-dependent Clp protease ATP-binding subunit ClpC
MANNFAKFSEHSRNVFSYAQEEAQRFNHNYLGTEHLLLGLIRDGDGIAGRVLANLGVQLPKSRSMMELIIGRGDGLVVGDPGLTPRAKKVIELAMDEARRLDSFQVDTEHLLLGIVREGSGIAAAMLESMGVSLEGVREAVMRTVTQSPESEANMREARMRGMWKVLLGFPDDEFDRLTTLADELGRPLSELIRETLRRTWLTNAPGTDAPDQHGTPDAS